MALTPDAVKKLMGQGLTVTVETGAGQAASAPDADYLATGAVVEADLAAALHDG